MTSTPPLQTFRFPEGACIAQAQPKLAAAVTLASPAREVFTDLAQVRAATIAPGLGLAAAREAMIQQGVRLLFVVEQLPCIVGLITSTDLEGDRPMQVIARRGLTHAELCVADVMTALGALDAIDYDELKAASVAHLVATLKRVGRRHLLVVQKANLHGAARIRGLVSMTQIERQLGRSLGATEIASTFAEIQQALRA